MYRALYRKWRPLTFSDVIGQQSIVEALQNQIKTGKIGHAYIFTGTRGTGKTTCAKIFAKAVNCQHTENGDACGKCELCKGVDDGSLLDVVEIDAASNNGVDNIRDLRDETAYTPSQCTYKVYIIDEVHMLSTAAFNALLKIMEEPPAHIIFILATTEIHKVPPTILSRCQRYDFMRISPNFIAERLNMVAEAEKITLDPKAAELISILADGAMRDALSILDTCAGVSQDIDEALVRRMAGVTDKSYLFNLSSTIEKKDVIACIQLLATLREKSIDIKHLTEELIYHYRNLLLAGLSGSITALNGTSEADAGRYITESKSISANTCTFAIHRLGQCLERIGKGADQRIELELALLQLCEGCSSVSAAVSNASAANLSLSPSIPKQPDKNNVSSANASSAKANAEKPNQSSPNNTQAAQGSDCITFQAWGQVVTALAQTDKALHSFLKNSSAYISGKRILIDAGAMFTNYIRQNDYSRDLIKQTIFDITGEKYGIGPYEKQADTILKPKDDMLTQLKQMGVDVIEN